MIVDGVNGVIGTYDMGYDGVWEGPPILEVVHSLGQGMNGMIMDDHVDNDMMLFCTRPHSLSQLVCISTWTTTIAYCLIANNIHMNGH